MDIKRQDVKALMIGLIASLSAIIVWDIVKSELKILNYKRHEKNRQ